MPDSIREMQEVIVSKETKIRWSCPRCDIENQIEIQDEGSFENCRKCGFEVEFMIKPEIYYDS